MPTSVLTPCAYVPQGELHPNDDQHASVKLPIRYQMAERVRPLTGSLTDNMGMHNSGSQHCSWIKALCHV